MNLERKILTLNKEYKPRGGLDRTATLFVYAATISHPLTAEHCMRVALIMQQTCKKMSKDDRAGYFGGELHDYGKIYLPPKLFDGHNFTENTEYEMVKTHAQLGYEELKNKHLFVALCAGLHHNLYEHGYGAGMDDIPRTWSARSVKKLLEISTMISIADFVDSYTTRTTTIKDGSDKAGPGLRTMLYQKYGDDHMVVDVVLESLATIFPEQAKKI